jgi:hypothetical protein
MRRFLPEDRHVKLIQHLTMLHMPLHMHLLGQQAIACRRELLILLHLHTEA